MAEEEQRAETGITFTQGTDGRLKGEFTRPFKEKLERAHNPAIVMVIGPTRAGKSTLLNQLLVEKSKEFQPKELQLPKPFAAAEGTQPQTQEFQFCEIKASELCRRNKLDLTGEDRDIFFVDTEGAGNLYKMSKNLHHGVFALESVAVCTLFMTQGTVDTEKVKYISSHLRVSKYFSKSLHGLAVVERDIGLAQDKSEGARVRQDEKETNKVRQLLNEGSRMNFDRSNFRCVAMPNLFCDTELFVNSIRDTAKFILTVATNQKPMTGSEIIKRFNDADSIVRSYPELLDTHCPVIELLSKIFGNKLDEVRKTIVETEIPRVINERIWTLSIEEFFEASQEEYKKRVVDEVMEIFGKKANAVFEGISEVIPHIYRTKALGFEKEVQSEAAKALTEVGNEAYRRVSEEIENAKRTTINEMKQKTATEVKEMTVETLRNLNGDEYKKRMIEEAVFMFSKHTCMVTENVRKRMNEANSSCSSALEFIKLYVTRLTESELRKRRDATPLWPKNEDELKKSLGTNALIKGKEYTLYTSNKEPYKVIFLGPGKLTLPGLKCIRHHRKEQLGCWKGARVYFDNKENIETWIDSTTLRAMVADPVVSKRNWSEGGHKSFFGKKRSPRPQQETVSLTIQVGNPWRITSFVKSGNNTVAKLTDGGHTFNVESVGESGDNTGVLNNVKLELDSGCSEPPLKARKL